MWLVGKTVAGVASGMRTDQIDVLAEEVCANAGGAAVDYHDFAAAIRISCMHKSVPSEFVDAMLLIGNGTETRPRFGPSNELITFADKYSCEIEAALSHERDYQYDYPSVHMLENGYALRRPDGSVGERVQHIYMRVACGLCMRRQPPEEAIALALRTYRGLRDRRISFATPIMRSAGTNRPCMISCYLDRVPDSIDGMYQSVKDFAIASKLGGGVGFSVSDIRAGGSDIRGSGSRSKGVVPYIRVINETKKHIAQGTNKRAGAGAPYLEPWHGDVEQFLDMKEHGHEGKRCRDLFFALWVPDLLIERVRQKAHWSLFCPDECPGLVDACDKEFERLYERYEAEGRARKRIPALDLLQRIIDRQVLHGGPYIMFKDTVNALSNQQHLGTITHGNLCTEIIQISTPGVRACCTLGALCLGSFALTDPEPHMDLVAIRETAGLMTDLVDGIIDLTDYPDESSRREHQRHRAIGIGVSGLADAFAVLRIPWDSERARLANRDIFETMQLGCLEASCRMARERGRHESFDGSPASRGLFQRDLMFARFPDRDWLPNLYADHIWDELRRNVTEYGLRNALLTALAPTASTAALTSQNESFEPFTSNLYVRRLGCGDIFFPNRHLIRLLRSKGLLDTEAIRAINRDGGSVRNVAGLSDEDRSIFRTVWELSQRTLMDLSADRQAYIDQSQSFNVHIAKPTGAVMGSLILYGHSIGLKTCVYYLRTKPPTEMIAYDKGVEAPPSSCSREPGCESCSM